MINQEEYEVLRNYFLRGIRWISRNKNGNLVVSKIKPDKFERKWLPQCPDEDWSELRNSETYLFLFIQWEDEEPYCISDLIKEYEDKFDVGYALKRFSESLIKKMLTESEEEMKKDKEWAFIELGKLFPNYTETHNYSDKIMDMKLELLNKVYDILTQLDEPEVLSQEWIDEHSFSMLDGYPWKEAVPVYDLQNLIVAKQEEVDRAYKDGYDTGRMHATEKQSEETETVARVLADYLIASAKLKLALSMEVKEVEE